MNVAQSSVSNVSPALPFRASLSPRHFHVSFLHIQMNATLRSNLVVGQFAVVFQLLSSKDQTLLFQGNASSVRNLVLQRMDRVGLADSEQQVLGRTGGTAIVVHHENGHGGVVLIVDTAASDSPTVVAQVVNVQGTGGFGSHGCLLVVVRESCCGLF